MSKKLLVILLISLGSAFFTLCAAQYTDLLNFNVTNGAFPNGSVTVPVAGVIYGLASSGGANDDGCVFAIDTDGTRYKDLFDFNGTTGKSPEGALIPGNGGVLYGITFLGGANNMGCIFSIDTNGSRYKDLLDFNGTNGEWPVNSVTLSSQGVLYGMTAYGGAVDDGCIFSIDTNGSNYKHLFDFTGLNGENPNGSLIIGGSLLYGMATMGGLNSDGCIFSIDTDGGGYRDLFDFDGSNGQYPYGTLTLSASGDKLYGMTSSGGGFSDEGVVFSLDTGGSNFSDLLIFMGGNGKFPPYNALTLSGNLLFGMTNAGGLNNYGVIFSIDTLGNGYTDLHDFNGTQGESPYGSLTLSGHVFYGVTQQGGAIDSGMVFKFNYTPTGTDELKANCEEVKVCPNPSNGKFTFQLSEVSSQWSVGVYNVLGEQVYPQPSSASADNSQLSIDLTGQPNGTYFYRVIANNACLSGRQGNIIGEGKLVIQK